MERPSLPGTAEERQRCALTGIAALPSALLSFVLDPAGRVVFDLKQNLPVEKRLWLVPHRAVVERAMRERVFAGLGENAVWDEDLPLRVQMQLERRLLETLSLLRRSGALIGGFEKVGIAIRQDKAVALVQAKDAAEDGRAKLAKLAGHHHIPVIALLTRGQLAAVTGQENQAHLALLRGGLAAHFMEESRRLAEYMAGPETQNA